jgi:two-component sensor histidine kinase
MLLLRIESFSQEIEYNLGAFCLKNNRLKVRCFFFFFFLFQLSYSQNTDAVTYGQKLIDENKLKEAISYFNKNLKNTITSEERIQYLLGLGDVYKLQMAYNASNQYYTEAYSVIKKTNSIQLLFLYHVKMAEFYRKRSMYQESLAQLDKAETILKKNKINDFFLSKYYNRKTALFTEYYGNNDSTLVYANKSLKIARSINQKDDIFYSILEIAGVYERKKDYKKAIKHLVDIIDFAEKNNMRQQQADAYISYVMCLSRDDQKQKALEIALKSAEIAKANNLLYNEIILINYVQKLYLKLNNKDKAYEFLKYRLTLTEKFNDLQKDEMLYNFEAKYKVSEKEQELKIKNLEISKNATELERNKIRFYIFIILIVGLIFIAFLISYFLRKTKNRNKQLQILSKQNEILVSETNHRVNNNLQLIAILIENNIRKNKDDNEKSEFKQLLTKVEAIASLHRHLYVAYDTNKVNLKEYIEDIKNNFDELISEDNIRFTLVIDTVEIHSDIVLFLGLLTTELLINSIKYAFNSTQEKEIELTIKISNNQLHYSYNDNGANSKNKVFKPALVEQLCIQLEVQHTITTENGFQFNFIKTL